MTSEPNVITMISLENKNQNHAQSVAIEITPKIIFSFDPRGKYASIEDENAMMPPNIISEVAVCLKTVSGIRKGKLEITR